MFRDFFKTHFKSIESRVAMTLFLSLLIHFISLFIYISDDFTQTTKNTSKKNKIKLVLRPDKDKKSKKKKQVVNNELTGREEVPKDSKFLGKKNQVYDRQTTAKTVGVFKEAGLGVKNGSKKPIKSKKVSKVKKKIVKKKNKQESKKVAKRKSKKKFSLADLRPEKEDLFKNEAEAISQPMLGMKHAKNSKRGLSQNNDFIEDLPLGDMTRLNTTEFKFYGFYHRIRQKLEQHWGASIREEAEKLFKQGRRIPASENKITSLMVTLDNNGNIVNVNVKSTSGIAELDSAAIKSFNKAGPFPNPPQGMLINGVAIIEWGFVVKG